MDRMECAVGKKTKVAGGVAQLLDARRRAVNSKWARRHPERAAEERALRLEGRETRDRWKHKRQGTPETHQKASRKRQGALARLYASGAISIDQLGAALEIAAVAERIGSDVSVRTVSLETRIDQSRNGDGAFFEALGQVRREVAYGRWRAGLPVICADGKGGGVPIAVALDMIVNDVGVTVAARNARIHVRRARKILTDALDAWGEHLWSAVRAVDEATLLAAQAGLL